MSKNLIDTLNSKDIEQLVSEAVKSALPKKVSSVNEAYVSKPKTFKQNTEIVSSKTKETHIALYSGYVDAINKVSIKLDSVDKSIKTVNSTDCDYRSLKLNESYNLNAKWLHELYFSNSFDPNSEIVMNSKTYMKFHQTWGTFDDWQRDFIAAALSCGNGWAVCGYNLHLRSFVNTMISNSSSDVMVGLYPLLVLDMHEHAYFKDYLNDKQSYIVKSMREFNWNVVEERIEKALAIDEVLK